MNEPWQMGLSALRDALDRGETSSEHIVDSFLRRREAVDERVNAWAHRCDEERLLERARAADRALRNGQRWGPLHGLPLSVKENLDVEGLPSTLGIPAWQGRRAERDALLVEEAQRAGALLLGKTNVPQTLLLPMETVNPLWGRTRNPWNPERSAGGSSGGEAAAIASGQSPAGLGTDIGGSIRIPSAFCAVFGLKPTCDRWSTLGARGVISGQEMVRAQTGPMGRCVEDLRLLMEALDPRRQAGRDPAVPPLAPPDPSSWGLEGATIGFYEDDGFFPPSEPARRAVREAVEALRAGGAQVVPYRPLHTEEILSLYFGGVSADGASQVESALAGGEVVEELRMLRRIAAMPAAARLAAARAMELIGERRVALLLRSLGRKSVATLWSLVRRARELRVLESAAWRALGLDALLCPVHVTAACPHGASSDFTLAFGYVARWNLLDFPAASVPWSRVRPEETRRRAAPADRLERKAAFIEERAEGLPIAVQVVAPPWREEVVLAVAACLEEAARSRDDFPAIPVDPRGAEHDGENGPLAQ